MDMKNIFVTCPTMAVHGGVRVICEWANHLSRRGHSVTLQIIRPAGYRWDNWIDIDSTVRIQVGQAINLNGYDTAVATFPAAALAMDADSSFCKKFYFLQMAEHLFDPNPAWHNLCFQSYKVKMPIIGISKWVEEEVRKHRGDGKMYYVGNGVSDDFKPGQKDEGLTVLVEGWGGYNDAKDVDLLAPRVAEVLHREYGAKIIAFSQFPLSFHKKAKQYEYILSEYHEAPSREALVRLYQRPTFMLKASRYDARSCAPVEAMKCGTVTVRAIERGDDDLIDMANCRKVGYDFNELLYAAKSIINVPDFRLSLESAAIEYATRVLNWETRISEIENILING